MEKRKIVFMLVALLGICLATGCGKTEYNEAEKMLVGEWGYIHEPETAILSVKNNGTAKYLNKTWDFSADEDTITLKSGNDTVEMYYETNPSNADQMFLFQQATYTFQDGETPDGLIGYWLCGSDNWSFEFTEKGTFREDGSFTGYYIPDEKNGTIRLVYENGMLEDTTFFYSVNGKEMTVSYPWKMARP